MTTLDSFLADLGAVVHSVDPADLNRMSRDNAAVSPVLRKSIGRPQADVVVRPVSKEEMAVVVRAAVKHRLPLTARGGGTANYGQSVPSRGGVVVDMTGFAGVTAVHEGSVRARAGTLMRDIDTALRPHGRELLIHPSTTATATIAGFIAGGSGGIGSASWGQLRDRGNITAVEVMSAEAEPRLVELTGQAVALVHHAWGTNGLITEVEMPIGPAWTWHECLVAFADFMAAARFGIQLARECGLIKKLISLQEWPLPALMKDLSGIAPEGHALVNCAIAEASMPAFRDLVTERGGRIVADHRAGENPFGAPLYEFAWGHGLRQLQKTDPRFTNFQGMFPGDRLLESLSAVHAALAGQHPLRLELLRSQGDVAAMGSHVFLYESDEQMRRMVEFLQGFGVSIANSHTTGVRQVGIKQFTAEDLPFKQRMDPHDLLNPGKLDFGEVVAKNLPTTGWSFKQGRP
jgi:FAD/FMN-containing dehydrogenase